MIPRQELEILLPCSNLQSLTRAEIIIDNFYELYSSLEKSQDFGDLTETALNKLKELTGVTSNLRLKKLFMDAKKEKLKCDNLSEVVALLQDSGNYLSTTYLVLPRDCKYNIDERFMSSSSEEFIKIRLTNNQCKIIEYVKNNLSEDGSLELGVQMLHRSINKIKLGFKSPNFWGRPINQIMNYKNTVSLFNLVGDTIPMLQKRYNDLESFSSQYLSEYDPFRESIEIMFGKCNDVDLKQENAIEKLMSIYFDRYVSWNYSKLVEKIGLSEDEYTSLIDIKNLESYGFFGIWIDSQYTKKEFLQALHGRKSFTSKKDLMENKNIKYIFNVLKPMIKGELAFARFGGGVYR